MRDAPTAPHTGEFLPVLGDLLAEPAGAFFHEVASTRGVELVDETLNAAPTLRRRAARR